MRTTTTTQIIVQLLERRPEPTPTDISRALGDRGIDQSPREVVELIGEISEHRDDVFVAPPECQSCGFHEYDNLVNIPSKCPTCRSEWIKEPRFTIRP